MSELFPGDRVSFAQGCFVRAIPNLNVEVDYDAGVTLRPGKMAIVIAKCDIKNRLGLYHDPKNPNNNFWTYVLCDDGVLSWVPEYWMNKE